ncbi:MAG: SAM-dependent methyltransferase [Bacteroidia bacterium]|jgi:SAM-dependent methyltransferase
MEIDPAEFSADFWNKRYEEGKTGWDIGYPSTPIKEYIDSLTDKSIRILIPGAGNAYEAEYLHQQGFENVYVLDIAENAIALFKSRVPDFPSDHLIHCDFFKHQGEYDLIFEQTFFCALPPSLRLNHADKMRDLLGLNGKLVGVMFNHPLEEKGPPWGGNEEMYRGIFKPNFDSINIKPCLNSIEPRQGSEYWVELSAPKK